jgi:hypothetical protein
MWIAVACILCCFDIVKAKDKNGVPVDPSGEYSSGFLW